MKNEQVRAAVAMIVFGTVLLSLACGGTQNSNQNQGQPNSNVGAPRTDEACEETNIDQRIDRIRKKLEDKIKDDSELKKHLEGTPGNPNHPPRLKFQVKKVIDKFAEVYIEGEINGRKELEDLIGIADDFMKKGCVERVLFVPDGTIPVPDATRSARFTAQSGEKQADYYFIWTVCEYPTRLCPDGICRENCMLDPESK